MSRILEVGAGLGRGFCVKTPNRASARLAVVAGVLVMCACEDPPPRPEYLEVGEETRAFNGPPTVFAVIDPRETTVHEVRVEWGHGVAPAALTNEELVPFRISQPLPAQDVFTVAFTLETTNQPLTDGDLAQYQFRVTHSTTGDDIFHWSQRGEIVVDPYDWSFCADTLLRVSAYPPGGPSAPDLGGWDADISQDGRFVAFTSNTAFDANDTNGSADVYLADLNARTFTRLSTSSSVPATQDFGGSQPTISGDGQFVAFTSSTPLEPNDTNNQPDVYRWSAASGGLLRVSWHGAVPGNEDHGGNEPSISSDGDFIAFSSAARLDPNDGNGIVDVYLADLTDGQPSFRRVSWNSSLPPQSDLGGSEPNVSDDGEYVAFTTEAPFSPLVDDNERPDVYRWTNAPTPTFQLVSSNAFVPEGQDNGGNQPHIASDGTSIVFTTTSPLESQTDVTGFPDVYRWRASGSPTYQRVSYRAASPAVPDSAAREGNVSPDGSMVAFTSATPWDANAREDTAQVYLRDIVAGTIVRISRFATITADVDHGGSAASVSAAARSIVFTSLSRLDPQGDQNQALDVYLVCR